MVRGWEVAPEECLGWKRKEPGETMADFKGRTAESLRRSMMKEAPRLVGRQSPAYVLARVAREFGSFLFLDVTILFSVLQYRSTIHSITFHRIVTILYFIHGQLRCNGRENRLGRMTAPNMASRIGVHASKEHGLIPHAANVDDPNRHASFVGSFHEAPRGVGCEAAAQNE